MGILYSSLHGDILKGQSNEIFDLQFFFTIQASLGLNIFVFSDNNNNNNKYSFICLHTKSKHYIILVYEY